MPLFGGIPLFYVGFYSGVNDTRLSLSARRETMAAASPG